MIRIMITGRIIVNMITDLVVTAPPASLVLGNSVSSTVRHVGVEPGQATAVSPAVGPHHGPIGQQGLPPELTSCQQNIGGDIILFISYHSRQPTWSA